MSQCITSKNGNTNIPQTTTAIKAATSMAPGNTKRGQSVDDLALTASRPTWRDSLKAKKQKLKQRSLTFDHFYSSSRKKSAAGAVLPSVITATKDTANPDISSTTSLEQLTEAATSDTEGAETSNGEAGEEGGSPGKLDIRSRINNLAFIFTLPHLVMLSNLQKLIGIRTGKKPSIQPNEYMDTLLLNAKTTMKERGLNEVQLPDQNMGVILYNGQMTGLDNLSRSGDALLEAATDHFLLSFSIEANDVKAKYWWKKQRLKGQVSAEVNQVTMKMQIKQPIQNNPPPELTAFTVEKIDGIHVSIYGLGPLNWIVRRVLRSLLRRHLREYLEREGRDVVQQELQNAALASEGDNLFTMLPQLVLLA